MAQSACISVHVSNAGLSLGALERHAQRFDELRDRDLALLERTGGDHLVAAERLACQAQEHLAVAAQALGGDRVKGCPQPRLGVLKLGESLGLALNPVQVRGHRGVGIFARQFKSHAEARQGRAQFVRNVAQQQGCRWWRTHRVKCAR
jgi:hypothetical protein